MSSKQRSLEPGNIEIGVVGLGLMGSSIIVSLLLSGHSVKAVAPIPEDMKSAVSRIKEQLNYCQNAGLLQEPVCQYESRLEISEDYQQLKNCDIVLECVIEDIRIKASVYAKIASAVSSDSIIASNTSAIAVSTLQQLVSNPQRFIGIHWAEPAYATRFMEITCGSQTCMENAAWVFDLAHCWGKEPTLLRKDIQGFITNRLMYAVYREIFALIEQGKATMEDTDKAFRYDAGSWMTFMGIFRRMDFTGLEDYEKIFRTIFPTLSNSGQVPEIMQSMVEKNARGTQNLTGLYNYSEKEAEEWEKAFALFNKDIYQLAALYPVKKMQLEYENIHDE